MSRVATKLLIDPVGVGTVFTPLGQRVYGLVHIAEGITVLVLGRRAPGLPLKYALWAALSTSRSSR